MSKRIPNHIREEAALICAIAASTPMLEFFAYREIEDILGRRRYTRSWKLAVAARMAATLVVGLDCHHAEAEALIRTGWTPD